MLSRKKKVEQLNKAEFVSGELFRLLRKLDGSIRNVCYQAIEEEYVLVHRADYRENQKIKVTAMNNSEIAVAVIQAVTV